jgi:hypothetical protein
MRSTQIRRLETHRNQSVNRIYTYLRLSLEVLWRLASSVQFLCKTLREEEDSVSPFPDPGENLNDIRLTHEPRTHCASLIL